MVATRLLVAGAWLCTASAHGVVPDSCYSLVAADYGLSIAGVCRPANGPFTEAAGFGGVRPLKAERGLRTRKVA